MPRFSVTQLLMSMALIAILIVFARSEGCGTRFSMIESLSFSSDDSRILVTKLTARDSQTAAKRYKSNLARTISWLDSSTGDELGVVHQDFKTGNSGPAFQYWWTGRTSVVCNPSNDQVAFCAFGGGDLTYGAGLSTAKTIPLAARATNLAISRSGRLLASSGRDQLTVLNTSTHNITLQTQADAQFFLGAALMSFNGDDSRLITAGNFDACIWDTTTGSKIATIPLGHESLMRGIAVMPDDSVIIGSGTWVKRYDLSGKLLNKFDLHDGFVCVASHGKNTLVVSTEDSITIRDVTNGSILRTLPIASAASLALSSDDQLLAVGDYDGHVSLVNLSNGDSRWVANPPGHYRWPWTIPAVALSVWCWIAYRLANRPQPRFGHIHTTVE